MSSLRFSIFRTARLTFALAVFLLSLLAIVKAPLHVLWKASIAVLELGHWAVLPCLWLAWLALWSRKSRGLSAKISALLFLASAVLLATPLARAVSTAHRLERSLPSSFRHGKPWVAGLHRRAPLVWKDLFGALHAPKPPRDIRTLVYAPGDSLSLDFYPAARPNAPCIVVVHGGGWDSDDRGELAPLNGTLATAGYAVASIDYRLAPRFTFPAPVVDLKNALSFLKRNAAGLGIDPSRFVLLGRSAGGQIALQGAYTFKDPAIRGVIAFYAPADMIFGYSLPGNPLLLDSRKLMDHYLGGSCSTRPELCAAASPLEFADASAPPTLLLHGHPDVLVSYRHTLNLDAKLARLGVPHFTADLPWATHGFDYFYSGPGSQISLYFIERFLTTVVP